MPHTANHVNSDNVTAHTLQYDTKTVNQLKAILKRKGLKTSGKKRDLVQRLLKSDYSLPNSTQHSMEEGEPVQVMSRRGIKSGHNLGSRVANGSPPHSPSDRNCTNISHGPRLPSLRSTFHERQERKNIVLYKHPVTTVHYFVLELLCVIHDYGIRLWRNKKMVSAFLSAVLLFVATYHSAGAHQKYVESFRKVFLWCVYWTGLGVLSSVGLGTGLHTFLLYLGPHIAAVTLAAYECDSVKFPEPPYPDDIICPEDTVPITGHISIWTIMSKVRLEACMWGAGTALGELPPYFMARAAALSGTEADLDELEEFQQLQEHRGHPQSFLERAKLAVESIVEKVGFLGILACASIPNPLFDLAGITCGHFLVPFWTFFGATLIGKAVIKMHIQKLFVIVTFSEHHVDKLVSWIGYVPRYGKRLQAPFKQYLQKQKDKLHHRPEKHRYPDANWLQWVFERVVMVMIAYFLLSIVNSMAQSYHKRLCKQRHLRESEKASGAQKCE